MVSRISRVELSKRSRDNLDVFTSPEFTREMHGKFGSFHFDSIEKYFLNQNRFGEFVELYGQAMGLPRIGVLLAHGDFENRRWTFTDGFRDYYVQHWVNQYDGQYAALLFKCCNPLHLDIHQKNLCL